MPFSLDDMLERMGYGGNIKGRECYREEFASVKTATKQEIAVLFPNVTLSESEELIYAPFRLCHSLPKVNIRGRCFTPTVLSNSFASVRDAAFNIDHQMKYRTNTGRDTICGHVVCGRFDPYGVYKDEIATAAKLPAEPIPLMALAAFYLRSEFIKPVLMDHLSGKRRWLTSMECSHKWDEAGFFYRGDIIPIKDAEPGMRECVQSSHVRNFKGHPLAVALGGKSGKVDFHASALTLDPADTQAEITAFVTNDSYGSSEAANSGREEQRKANPFFFPLETRTFQVQEDNEVLGEDELANIAILGQTEPCNQDGHMHDVLTDGTVMSNNGHAHRLSNFNVSRGSNPRLTGKTDTHYSQEPDGTGRSVSKEHLHMVNIALKGKGTKPGTKSGDATASLAGSEINPVPVSQHYHTEIPVDKLLERIMAALNGGQFKPENAGEVASLKGELQKFSQENFVKQMVTTEIANQVQAGALVKKEDHEKKLTDAVAAEKTKAEAEAKQVEKRTARREKVVALGIGLEDKFDDKIQMTVGAYVDSFGLDDAGEQLFAVALAQIEAVVKLTQPAEKPAETPVTSGTETVAANSGKKPPERKGNETAAKPVRKLLSVGRGGNESSPEGEEQGGAAPKKVGRHLFTKPI